MDSILYFFRDTITGTYYFMYAFVCLFLMFSLIGYLFKDKYAKVTINLGVKEEEEPRKKTKKQAKEKVVLNNSNVNQTINKTNPVPEQPKINQEPLNQQPTQVNYQNLKQTPIQQPTINQQNNNPIVKGIPEIK